MNTEIIRKEMLKCHTESRANLITSSGKVFMMWVINSNLHEEVIDKCDCVVGSEAFTSLMAKATEAMKF